VSRPRTGRTGHAGRPGRTGQADPARLAAYDVLVAVREQDAYANLVLPPLLRERGLTGRDAAFATELVGGTLRGLGPYDVIVDHLTGRAPDPAVRDALRLGAHQLLGMRVPDHAAVSGTVEVVRTRVGHKPVGFVNAVLRRMAERDLDGWMDHLDAPRHVRWSHPEWVVDALAEALAAPEEVVALLAADNERPRVTLVARPGLSTVEELRAAAQGVVVSTGSTTGGSTTEGSTTEGAVSPWAVVLESGDPGAIPAVREGRAGVQDAGSQLVALALVRATVEGSDARWLDLCAGPGGKAALLAALATQRGARLLANERQPHRARLVAQALRATTGDVVAGDGTRPAWRPGTFDRVLVDAPCSGLGALRRRPESRWRRSPDDLESLVPLQRALLTGALDSVRPGGVVVYATCSPVVAETAGVVQAVLGSQPDVLLEDARPLLPEVERADSAHLDGAVQLWPHRHGTDAMFLALLRRRE
jgi:16S rRNA (cytosine967-C5)-methyltransferase